jgi:hypothetical protein
VDSRDLLRSSFASLTAVLAASGFVHPASPFHSARDRTASGSTHRLSVAASIRLMITNLASEVKAFTSKVFSTGSNMLYINNGRVA